MLLGAYWVWLGLGRMWRQFIWSRVGAGIRRVAGDRPITGTWTGWKVERDDVTVWWCGGMLGPYTLVRGASEDTVFGHLEDRPLGDRG